MASWKLSVGSWSLDLGSQPLTIGPYTLSNYKIGPYIFNPKSFTLSDEALKKLGLSVAGSAVGLFASYQLLKAVGVIKKREWVKVAEVTELYLYPIKSCKGTSVPAVELDRYGAVGDRRFMIVDDAGRFLSQRTDPQMCHIHPKLQQNGTVVLDAPHMGTITHTPVLKHSKTNDLIWAEVWEDKVKAVEQGNMTAAWLSSYMQKSVSMVGMGGSYSRPTKKKYTPSSTTGQVSFADGFPLLVISEESLNDLNSKMKESIGMDRFRPNVVIKGCQPFAEDTWKKIRIGDQEMFCVKPCSRCKIPTIDQKTGKEGLQPKQALDTYRTKEDIGTKVGDKSDIFFGQNLIHCRPGKIKVGDAVYALM